jgi:hypothetical protein
MFRSVTAFSIGACALALFAWAALFSVPRASDLAAYGAFMKEKTLASTSSHFASATKQRRSGVRKDIWFAQEDNSRLHYRIESASSVLTLLPQDQKMDLVETLQEMRCWMQDKLYTGPHSEPMQQMRYLEAAEGVYRYSTQQFLAQTVSLSLFRTPGHELSFNLHPRQAFLKGVGQDVSFVISGKVPQFQAQHFKASFQGS